MNGQARSPECAMVSPWIEAFAAKYGAIILGVGIGTGAKYRLAIADGRGVKWSEIFSDLLILPMICMLTGFIVGKVGADPETAGMIGAFMALSANQILRILRDRFVQRVSDEADIISANKGEARQVGAIITATENIKEEGLNAPTAAARFGDISREPGRDA